MREYLVEILEYAISKTINDIHFYVDNDKLKIYMRNRDGMFLYDEDANIHLLEYLRYITNMDMSSSNKMQSGSYAIEINHCLVPLRFSYICTPTLINGALRILQTHQVINVNNLSVERRQNQIFKNSCKMTSGLILLSGATGSGKTTTLYALLDECKANHKSIFTLEDPVELTKPGIIQLQVHEPDVTYENGLKQALRHDPDVIMVGEIRDAQTAKMVIRCALTGHLVLSTIHANSASGVINRMLELGVNKDDLGQVLQIVSSQRLIKGKNGLICVYDILEDIDIERVLNGENISCKLDRKILELFKKNLVSKSELKKLQIAIT